MINMLGFNQMANAGRNIGGSPDKDAAPEMPNIDSEGFKEIINHLNELLVVARENDDEEKINTITERIAEVKKEKADNLRLALKGASRGHKVKAESFYRDLE